MSTINYRSLYESDFHAPLVINFDEWKKIEC